MQGIINSGMSAEDAARPQQMQRSTEPMPQRQSNGVDMDPAVAQEQRNVLVNAMLGRLYGEQLDSAAKILDQSADNPVEGIGRVVSGLLGAAYKSVTDQGRAVPPGVMFQAGMMASQAVGEMAMRMGLIDEQTEAEMVESGFMMALGNFGRANGKQMSDEERERYGQLIDGLEEGKRMAMSGERANDAEMAQDEQMTDAERYRQLKAQTEEAGMQVREDGGRVIAERAEQRPAGDMDRQGGIISRGGA
jgi:hypothetical protein